MQHLHRNECQKRIRAIIERTLTGKARINAYKDKVAEAEQVKKSKRARVERGAGGVLMEPGNEEQLADRHVVASGEEGEQHADLENPHWYKRIGDSK